MVSFTIVSGWYQWFVFGAYVPHTGQPTVHRVDQIVGDLDARLAQPRKWHAEDLLTVIANCGLEYQTLHSIPC